VSCVLPRFAVVDGSDRVAIGPMTTRLLSHFIAILVVLVSTCAVAAPVVGTVTKVEKQAQIGSTTAVVGTPVHMKDKIRTGRNARLEVTFSDDTTLTVGENALMVVDRYVFDPGASTGVLALNASRGAMRFATGKLGKMKNKDITVATPGAALAVRGTVFWAGLIDLQYGVLLLSKTGRVDVGNSGGEVTLSAPGQGTDLPPALCDEDTDYKCVTSDDRPTDLARCCDEDTDCKCFTSDNRPTDRACCCEAAPEDPYTWSEAKVARALASTSFGLAAGSGVTTAVATAVAVGAAIVIIQKPKPSSP
jgi:hypothetical protein